MNTILRYAAVVAFVLAALVVLMVCGEGLCESCGHGCLSRVDRADRFRRTVARIFDRMVSATRVIVSRPMALSVRPLTTIAPPDALLSTRPAPLLI